MLEPLEKIASGPNDEPILLLERQVKEELDALKKEYNSNCKDDGPNHKSLALGLIDIYLSGSYENKSAIFSTINESHKYVAQITSRPIREHEKETMLKAVNIVMKKYNQYHNHEDRRLDDISSILYSAKIKINEMTTIENFNRIWTESRVLIKKYDPNKNSVAYNVIKKSIFVIGATTGAAGLYCAYMYMIAPDLFKKIQDAIFR